MAARFRRGGLDQLRKRYFIHALSYLGEEATRTYEDVDAPSRGLRNRHRPDAGPCSNDDA